ncbi:glycosyltransferase family 2 protein [Danxiaibacter flavus]|uniref:Glycosyltransferase family 2 protein n=1 Tax=Danxiaibacter flavus TaxID=3049108 RepID=A0ABV3ZG86_9BACT|nr:glycosyltransferase family 2 protein [Chitinophagaceae bacterium DXS]
MKISGFTIIKNAVINDYPIVEAITSILPVVDEMIVLVGDCDDDTEELVRSINSNKIKIHHSVWDQSLRHGGKVLAVETDKAFQLIDPASDWAFYIQADEVVHEQYYPAIIEACKKYKDDMRVQGLLFKYLHFYGTYDYVGDSRKWYNREIRIIRNNKAITAYRDAQGFRIGTTKLPVKPIDAYVYHYGWVKSPKLMKQKMKNVSRFWNDDTDEWQQFLASEDVFNYDDFDSLQKFTATHPSVMQKRVAEQNWRLNIDISKKHFDLKDRFLYWFERKTGIRPFDFKNYTIVK